MVFPLISPWKTLDNFIIFWGFEVISYVAGLFLSQHKYIMDILDDVGMLHSKGAPTPMTSTTILITSVNGPSADGTLYRRVIEKLNYLFFSRSNIAFKISKLSQFMHNSRHSH